MPTDFISARHLWILWTCNSFPGSVGKTPARGRIHMASREMHVHCNQERAAFWNWHSKPILKQLPWSNAGVNALGGVTAVFDACATPAWFWLFYGGSPLLRPSGEPGIICNSNLKRYPGYLQRFSRGTLARRLVGRTPCKCKKHNRRVI